MDTGVPSLATFDAIIFSFLVVGIVTTALRLWTPGSLLKSLRVDDVLAIFATISVTITMVLQHLKIMYNHRYLDTVVDGQPAPGWERFMTWENRYSFLNQLFYASSLCLIKASLLAFYSRFLISKKALWLLYFILGSLVAFTLGFILVTIFGRTPIQSLWYPFDPQYRTTGGCTCKLLSVIYSSFHAFIDFLILVIPIPILWGLKINRRTKAGLVAVYMLGFFTFGTTVVRLVQAVQFRAVTDYVQRESKLTIFSIWSAIETTTALICANLPALSAMLKRAYKKRVMCDRPNQLLNRISDTSFTESSSSYSDESLNEKFRDAKWNTRVRIEARIEEGQPF